jgi:hypothetical protein
MTIDEFWELIESTRLADGRAHAARLITALSVRSVDDILDFGHWFNEFHRTAYRWDLWGAAYLIGGGCSNDGFEYFRTGLILRGREVYEAALANPNNLADVSDARRIELEEYIGPKAYQLRTGRDDFYDEMERRFPSPALNVRRPAGEDLDFDSAQEMFDNSQEMQQRYPRLWKRFGW